VISLKGQDVSEDAGNLDPLHRAVYRKTGMDLHPYKEKFLRRRVAVRLRATGCENVARYVAYLESDEEELDKLLLCLTIHVSSFFRNPSTFRAVEEKVFPDLFAGPPSRPVRLWSVGCARGEEPYSLAILISEYLGEDLRGRNVRIEAIDIDEKILEEAKGGGFRKSQLKELDPSLEKRYFVKNDSYRIVPGIRKMVKFHRLDILMDPPAGEYDFILCRNLLIYIERKPQEQIVEHFSRVLRPGGFLALGRTEVLVGPAREAFEVVDARERIYRKAG
jgi:chemotaxis protein methyltransferase CheR